MVVEVYKQAPTMVEVIKGPTVFIDVVQRPTVTYEVVNKKVELVQNKQTGLILFDVPCESNVFVGAAVVMRPDGVAKLAIATSYADANVIGIVNFKNSSVLCDIRFFGATEEIFNNLDVAEEYYLSDSTPGAIVPTSQAPLTTGHIRIKLGQPFSSKQFVFVKGERIIKG